MATLGADPEFFLEDPDGNIVIACGKIGGTKDKPLHPRGWPPGFAVQEDNVMVEYNTPPTSYAATFSECVIRGRELVEQYASKKIGRRMVAHDRSYARLTTQALREAGSQALMFGCSPEFDAYSGGASCPTVEPESLNSGDGASALRFAGGHIHMGYSTKEHIPPFVVAQFADVYLGLLAVTLGERQEERRTLYGQAGRFRPTSYGLEYRTLGNFWVMDGYLCGRIADAAADLGALVERVPVERLRGMYADAPWADVRESILKEDETACDELRAFLFTEWRGAREELDV